MGGPSKPMAAVPGRTWLQLCTRRLHSQASGPHRLGRRGRQRNDWRAGELLLKDACIAARCGCQNNRPAPSGGWWQPPEHLGCRSASRRCCSKGGFRAAWGWQAMRVQRNLAIVSGHLISRQAGSTAREPGSLGAAAPGSWFPWHRTRRTQRTQRTQLFVVGAKVVAPLAAAVRLVDGDALQPALLVHLLELWRKSKQDEQRVGRELRRQVRDRR